MAGYIVLVLPHEKVSKVLPLFRQSETNLIELNPDTTLIYVSNSGSVAEESLFHGYAIDHEREKMVFTGAPSSQLPEPSEPMEGSYFTAKFDSNTFTCAADLFGHVSMVWFGEQTMFAVSDSFLTLVTIRRALSLPVSLDETTVRSRSWLNSMALSQLGPATYCREIKYATPGTTLTVDLKSGSTQERLFRLEEFYASTFENHAHAIDLSSQRMVRTLKTYAETGALALIHR